VMLPNNDDETKRIAAKAVREIFGKAVELGGTLSGEHGIGYAKAPFLDVALTAPTIGLMRTIKQALDPNGILNPGKVLQPAFAAEEMDFLTSDFPCC
jgi:FAD/FMN-containing dehydrogenase